MNFTVFPNLSKLDGNISSSAAEPASPGEVLTWTVVALFICLTGCCNCFIMLYVSWPRTGDKSGVNLLIFHFVATNLFMVLFHYPTRIIMVQARRSGHVASLITCEYLQTIHSTNFLVTICSDAGLAINRCVALYLPHQYIAYSSTRINLTQIIGSWLICLILVLPSNFGIGGYVTIVDIGHCVYRFKNGSAYGNLFAMASLAPLAINGVASVLILVKCYCMSRISAERRSSLLTANERSAVHSTRVRHRVRLAQMLVLTYVFALFCNIPANVIVNLFPKLTVSNVLANLWPQTCSATQYAFTPCILFLCNTRYRDRLRKLRDRIWPVENIATLRHATSRQYERANNMKLSMLNSVSRVPSDS